MNRLALGAVVLLPSLLGAPTLAAAAPGGSQAAGSQRMIVVARTDAAYDQVRQDVEGAGGSVVKDLRSGRMLVVKGSAALKAHLQSNARVSGVATDRVESIVPPRAAGDLLNASTTRPSHARSVIDSARSAAAGAARGRASVAGDPAFGYPGLMWSILRIHAPEAWRLSTGRPEVLVGVADTGLDFTHLDLKSRIADVVDFTGSESPPICQTAGGFSDADLANQLGGPLTTDWNGHGSWIGGNIAAALDGAGVNGIAPNVKLVSLKISQWCGSAYDSEILDALLYAADHHIDVVSVSFDGYLDTSDPDQQALYNLYVDSVQYARRQGTLVVSSAGNEHVQVGAGGRVVSHGSLTTPGEPAVDLFGLYETPAGVPGVVDVSATGNVVTPSSATCAPGSAGTPDDFNAVCKPASDPHQAPGTGKLNQLAYYSNYGSRIDLAGPGGARKFNLPNVDRGGTPGFPYTTDDLTTAFEDFSTTSNWAQQVPCFVFSGGGFPADQCYSTIQGTSMATPHVSAVAALIASSNRDARHNPARIEQVLKATARRLNGNTTQVLNATDRSPGDLSGIPCLSGYCHLGGKTISDDEAYGAGLVDAQRAVGDNGPRDRSDDGDR